MPDPVRIEWRLPEHAEALFAVLDDASLYEYVDIEYRPASVVALRALIERNASRKSPDGCEDWLNWIVRDADGELVGYVQATVRANGEANIAYTLGSAHWGRGLAVAAVEQMLALLEADYGVRTHSIVAERANARSVGLARRLRFQEVLEPSTQHALSPSEILLQRSFTE